MNKFLVKLTGVSMSLMLGSISVGAQTIDLVEGSNPLGVKATVSNNTGQACGVEFKFGDGKEEKKRLEAGEISEVLHAYASKGNYVVSAKGVIIFRGLRTVAPCSADMQFAVDLSGEKMAVVRTDNSSTTAKKEGQQEEKPTNSATTQNTAGAWDDVYVYANKGYGTPNFTKNVDGIVKFSPEARLESACLTGGGLFDIAPMDADRNKIIADEVARTITSMGGRPGKDFKINQCGPNPSGELILVRSTALVGINSSDRGRYDKIFEIKGSFIAAGTNDRKNSQGNAAKSEEQRRNEIKASGSEDVGLAKIGSLTLRYPENRNEPLSVCTISRSDALGQGILGYRSKLSEYLNIRFKERADSLGSKLASGLDFQGVYTNIDEFYTAFQSYQPYGRSSPKCHIYVDALFYLNKIATAVERDRKAVAYEVNGILDIGNARKEWASSNGYSDLEEAEFGVSLRGNSAQVKKLKSYGVSDREIYNKTVAEIKSLGYSDSTALSVVLTYLDDRKAADGKPGQTALTIKTERDAEQKRIEERRIAEQRLREERINKEYPYTAVITCGMGSSHAAIGACFAGGRASNGTSIELRNGDEYGLYRVWDLPKLGRETREGLVIRLRDKFEMSMRNSHEALTLSVRVVDSRTDKVLFQRSATQYRSINISN